VQGVVTFNVVSALPFSRSLEGFPPEKMNPDGSQSEFLPRYLRALYPADSQRDVGMPKNWLYLARDLQSAQSR
jgi:hypothetical protein